MWGVPLSSRRSARRWSEPEAAAATGAVAKLAAAPVQRLIFRADAPDEGQILVNSRNLLHIRESEVPYLRRMIGFVFQDFRLLPKKTVFENVALALKVSGVPERVLRVRVAETLGAVGLGHKLDGMPTALSAGEQQRVCLARALVNDPQILLADEPTGNLDADVAEETMLLLFKIRERGTTIIVASHDLNMINRYGTRVVLLQRGALADDLRLGSRPERGK